MDPALAASTVTAIGAVIAAAIMGRKTRKTRPELASSIATTQVGYMAKVNDRLNAEIERLEEDRAEDLQTIMRLESELAVERRKSEAQDAQIRSLNERLQRLEARLETALDALARRT